MEKIFLGNAAFVWGAERPDDLPPADLPEVAFAGRSNVGKSSLINALLNRKSLVRTSSTPGQTRALNFFNIADHFMLVDMPGYGFAKASKADQKIWRNLLTSYLKGRVPLRLTCLLIDARHGFKDTDRKMLHMLGEAAVPVRIVLTKADETKKAELDKTLAAMHTEIKTFASAHPVPIITSTRKKQGIDDLRTALLGTLGLTAPAATPQVNADLPTQA